MPDNTPSDQFRSENDRDPFDADAATVRSLSLITGGRPLDFTDHETPPGMLRRWLRRANLRQARGLLLEALRRWHELGGR